MEIEVALTPGHLSRQSLEAKTVVVFDVLRATTTIIAALAAKIRAVHAFAELSHAKSQAKSAAESSLPRPILCGEINALPAPGVDLGNSPGQFLAQHAGRDLFMCTTNGTRAIVAARSAAALFVGALVNAAAVAKAVISTHRNILLLGSGTSGDIAMEDVIGAGAVCEELLRQDGYSLRGDAAQMAHRLFLACRNNLPAVLRNCQGGRNIIKARLEPDIDFAARLNVFDIVGLVDTANLVIRKLD